MLSVYIEADHRQRVRRTCNTKQMQLRTSWHKPQELHLMVLLHIQLVYITMPSCGPQASNVYTTTEVLTIYPQKENDSISMLHFIHNLLTAACNLHNALAKCSKRSYHSTSKKKI